MQPDGNGSLAVLLFGKLYFTSFLEFQDVAIQFVRLFLVIRLSRTLHYLLSCEIATGRILHGSLNSLTSLEALGLLIFA